MISDFPIRALRQEVNADLGGIFTVPWVGMERDGCKYLDGNCAGSEGQELVFSYPAKIQDAYPPVITHYLTNAVLGINILPSIHF